MNRKDRRAQRAQERKARRTDTMGTSFHIGPLPEHVTNHPAFQEGQRAAEKGEGFPPRYYDDIEKAAKLIAEWVHAQPMPPDLRWIEQKDDGVFIAAALDDVGASYLADSPDAFALLAWLDEKTGRRLSLNQATWAHRRCRALPMPDGSYVGVTTSRESDAYKTFLRMADRVAKSVESDRCASSPCGHCGKRLDAASSADGHKPNEGDLSVCVYCCGVNTFDAQHRLVKLTQEQFDALPPEVAAQLGEMQALMRSTIAKAFRGKAKGPAPEA